MFRASLPFSDISLNKQRLINGKGQILPLNILVLSFFWGTMSETNSSPIYLQAECLTTSFCCFHPKFMTIHNNICFKQLPARWTFEEIFNSWDWNNMFPTGEANKRPHLLFASCTVFFFFFMAGFKHESDAQCLLSTVQSVAHLQTHGLLCHILWQSDRNISPWIRCTDLRNVTQHDWFQLPTPPPSSVVLT